MASSVEDGPNILQGLHQPWPAARLPIKSTQVNAQQGWIVKVSRSGIGKQIQTQGLLNRIWMDEHRQHPFKQCAGTERRLSLEIADRTLLQTDANQVERLLSFFLADSIQDNGQVERCCLGTL